jgi:programmed cell death 6-interacting protein
MFNLINFKPPIMNEAHEDENLFGGFVSEEAVALSKDISEFVDKKRYELEETLKVLNDQKNKAYEDNYVNALLDIAHG